MQQPRLSLSGSPCWRSLSRSSWGLVLCQHPKHPGRAALAVLVQALVEMRADAKAVLALQVPVH